VLSLADDVVYKPQTKETRAAYEAMLSVIQQQFGGQPMDVLGGAADEVLAILKNDKIKNPDKKKEIDKLLNPIPTHVFEQFVSIGKLITDFHDASDPAAAAPSADGVDATMDDDIGVAVEFEEDDDDEESDFDQVCSHVFQSMFLLLCLFTVNLEHVSCVHLYNLLPYLSSSGAR
jgi:pre-mRNA-splicing helicase BRR2